jgi:hypothetical protein
VYEGKIGGNPTNSPSYTNLYSCTIPRQYKAVKTIGVGESRTSKDYRTFEEGSP